MKAASDHFANFINAVRSRKPDYRAPFVVPKFA